MTTLDRLVSDAIADGKITEDDAATILKFGEFLEAIGPRDEGRGKRLRAYMNASPENRAFVLETTKGRP